MGGKKRSKPCGYLRPHKAHTYEHQSSMPYGHREKRWCGGMPVEQQQREHVHIWDKKGPIYREGEGSNVLEGATLWNGPFECSCGRSAWLVDGRAKRELEDRFPKADMYTRIVTLRAKLARGKEEWTRADQQEFEAIGQSLVEQFKPIQEAFAAMAEQVSDYLQSFFDRIDPVMLAQLTELAKAHGEKPDTVETVTLMGDNIEPIEIVVSGGEPMSAQNAVALTEILADEDQSAPVDLHPWSGSVMVEPGEAIVRGERVSHEVIPDIRVHSDGRIEGLTELGRSVAERSSMERGR